MFCSPLLVILGCILVSSHFPTTATPVQQFCQVNAHCSAPNTICYYGRCECTFGYAWSSDNNGCTEVTCNLDTDCSSRFSNAICNPLANNTCTCFDGTSIDQLGSGFDSTGQLSCSSPKTKWRIYFCSRVIFFLIGLALGCIFLFESCLVVIILRRLNAIYMRFILYEGQVHSGGGEDGPIYGVEMAKCDRGCGRIMAKASLKNVVKLMRICDSEEGKQLTEAMDGNNNNSPVGMVKQ